MLLSTRALRLSSRSHTCDLGAAVGWHHKELRRAVSVNALLERRAELGVDDSHRLYGVAKAEAHVFEDATSNEDLQTYLHRCAIRGIKARSSYRRPPLPADVRTSMHVMRRPLGYMTLCSQRR